MPSRNAQHRAGAVNQQRPQVDIAAFTDAMQADLPTYRILPRH
jgi:hypothetical protein